MLLQELISEFNLLFKDYEIAFNWGGAYGNDYYLYSTHLVIKMELPHKSFYVVNYKSVNLVVYQSSTTNDYEKLYDEVIIFKELIMPGLIEKYK